MDDTTNVKGLRELDSFLSQLEPKLQRNVLRGGLRAGMGVVLPAAKSGVHSVSGELAAGLKLGTRYKDGVVMGYIKTTGKHSFLAKWVEFGTRAHQIRAKDGSFYFGGRFVKSVQHPGAQKKPFMRPALDAEAQPAIIAMAEYIRNKLSTKFGLDTAGIAFEGDE
jgi:HK97 gp10 family phage protein